MPSVTYNGGRFSIRVTYETSQSVEKNATTVRVTRVEVKSNQGDEGDCVLYGSVMAQGKWAAWLEFNDRVWCKTSLGSFYSGGGSRWSGWYGYTPEIPHDESGNLELKLSVDIDIYTTDETLLGRVRGTVSRSMPTIPRTAAILAEGVELGTPMAITLNRVNDFQNTLSWQCGALSGVIAEHSSDGEFVWTPPLELAGQAVRGTTAEVVLTVVSISGTTALGSRSLTVQCPLPASLIPTLRVELQDTMGYAARFGGFVQNKSRLLVQTQAAGVYGSAVEKIAVEFDGLSAQGEQVTFVPMNAGTIPLAVTVTDSRGRTAVQSLAVTVQHYEAPRVEIQSLDRCDKQGSLQRDGGYAKVVFAGTVTSLGDTNPARYTLRRSLRGGEQGTDLSIPGIDGVFVFPASIDQDYECQIMVRDAFETAKSGLAALSVAFALLDFNRSNRALGLGRRASNANMVSVGLDMKLHGHRITDLADPEEDRDAIPKAWLEALYPVGAVYLSAVDSCVPGLLFGGTWQRVEDRFLLAAGQSYPAGTTGGEAAHTLTAEELPSHSHGQRMSYGPMVDSYLSGARVNGTQADAYEDNWFGDHCPQVYTDAAGGGQAHNNMPPYLSVYVWVRTA